MAAHVERFASMVHKMRLRGCYNNCGSMANISSVLILLLSVSDTAPVCDISACPATAIVGELVKCTTNLATLDDCLRFLTANKAGLSALAFSEAGRMCCYVNNTFSYSLFNKDAWTTFQVKPLHTQIHDVCLHNHAARHCCYSLVIHLYLPLLIHPSPRSIRL